MRQQMSQQSLEKKMKKTVKPLMKKNHIRSNKMQGSTANSDMRIGLRKSKQNRKKHKDKNNQRKDETGRTDEEDSTYP